jgi:hypothetical protein
VLTQTGYQRRNHQINPTYPGSYKYVAYRDKKEQKQFPDRLVLINTFCTYAYTRVSIHHRNQLQEYQMIDMLYHLYYCMQSIVLDLPPKATGRKEHRGETLV